MDKREQKAEEFLASFNGLLQNYFYTTYQLGTYSFTAMRILKEKMAMLKDMPRGCSIIFSDKEGCSHGYSKFKPDKWKKVTSIDPFILQDPMYTMTSNDVANYIINFIIKSNYEAGSSCQYPASDLYGLSKKDYNYLLDYFFIDNTVKLFVNKINDIRKDPNAPADTKKIAAMLYEKSKSHDLSLEDETYQNITALGILDLDFKPDGNVQE